MSDTRPEVPSQVPPAEVKGLINRIIRFFLENKLVVFLLLAFLVLWGMRVMPFDPGIEGFARDPIPIDAIPDLGENQQVVFTEWPGRSPQDVEDQITYPLTTALQGTAGFRSIRATSMFGFSVVYVIFEEKADFYWTRARLLEKLNVAAQLLPEGVTPTLGPDATGLGQVYWYTLEGSQGGFDLMELRSIQDWYVRYALQAIPGVSEVASAGGHVREYQIDVDPDAMRAHGVGLMDVFTAVQRANIDVGAETIEWNGVEYIVRGKGFIRTVQDIEDTVIRVERNVPIYIKHVAQVQLGPALRRGMLDKEGVEAVGGVVTVRYGANPLQVIELVKERIAEISPGLPRKTLEDGTVSQVQIVPFYDRTTLIHETLNTLQDALIDQVLITIFVVLIFIMHFRSAMLICLNLPVGIMMAFIMMKWFGIESNLMSLGGIAIAIGTMIDMGIIMTENIVRHVDEAPEREDPLETVYRASSEVGSAVVTAIATTVVSFLPIFVMVGEQGKLFKPLAYTKTFALIASVTVALLVLPALAHLMLSWGPRGRRGGEGERGREGDGVSGAWLLRFLSWRVVLLAAGIWGGLMLSPWAWLLAGYAVWALFDPILPPWGRRLGNRIAGYLVAAAVLYVLTLHWMPLGHGTGVGRNLIFVFVLTVVWSALRLVFIDFYPYLLNIFLRYKAAFLAVPLSMIVFALVIWLGFGRVFGWLPHPSEVAEGQEPGRYHRFWVAGVHEFPGLGREFMPPLDEGSFLYMPTIMPHAGIGPALEAIAAQDEAISAIPEVLTVVGKIGRAETALDPAPVSMIETLIQYKPEYLTDEQGRVLTFQYDEERIDYFRAVDGTPIAAPDGKPYLVHGAFPRDEHGLLIPDPSGRAFRQWRAPLDPRLNPDRDAWAGIRRPYIDRKGEEPDPPDTIWGAVLKAADFPGVTGAPYLQPIEARQVMIRTGMRAPMGIKVYGHDLDEIQEFGFQIAEILKRVPGVQAEAVVPDRIIGKPYLEIDIDRQRMARYGVNIRDVQDVIEIALGGIRTTTTVEGRERYPVRVRYAREIRDSVEAMERILVPGAGDQQIPLSQLATIEYIRGPQEIKSEDNFLVSYVTFDRRPGHAEVEVVEDVLRLLKHSEETGELVRPAGIRYEPAGTYESQLAFQRELAVMLPLSLAIIFMILYFQFRSVPIGLLVFLGVAVAWSGGFIGLWLTSQDWFLNFEVFGRNVRDVFNLRPYNLSTAVWVGFIALFGIATDDGVVITTYLNQTFRRKKVTSIKDIRAHVIEAGNRRVRPCLMTTTTTVLALMPILTSTGRGADVMIPMALPAFWGMTLELVTLFTVPVTYCLLKEWLWRTGLHRGHFVTEDTVEPGTGGSTT